MVSNISVRFLVLVKNMTKKMEYGISDECLSKKCSTTPYLLCFELTLSTDRISEANKVSILP